MKMWQEEYEAMPRTELTKLQSERLCWQVTRMYESVELFRKRMDEAGRTQKQKFQYELPHLVHSPCKGCLCEKWCDKPCSQRLAWWDARVRRNR